MPVAVDHGFATAERIALDQTSWVDHVHGWLSGDARPAGAVCARRLGPALALDVHPQGTEPRLTAEYPVVADAPLPVLHHLADSLSAHYDRRSRLWMNWYRDHRDGTGWHADRPADQQARRSSRC